MRQNREGSNTFLSAYRFAQDKMSVQLIVIYSNACCIPATLSDAFGSVTAFFPDSSG
jgi:hypothetical protein